MTDVRTFADSPNPSALSLLGISDARKVSHCSLGGPKASWLPEKPHFPADRERARCRSAVGLGLNSTISRVPGILDDLGSVSSHVPADNISSSQGVSERQVLESWIRSATWRHGSDATLALSPTRGIELLRQQTHAGDDDVVLAVLDQRGARIAEQLFNRELA